jgi:hypothetical protein
MRCNRIISWMFTEMHVLESIDLLAYVKLEWDLRQIWLNSKEQKAELGYRVRVSYFLQIHVHSTPIIDDNYLWYQTVLSISSPFRVERNAYTVCLRKCSRICE